MTINDILYAVLAIGCVVLYALVFIQKTKGNIITAATEMISLAEQTSMNGKAKNGTCG